jgi:7 transmembrane receptor (rhodopsin family)
MTSLDDFELRVVSSDENVDWTLTTISDTDSFNDTIDELPETDDLFSLFLWTYVAPTIFAAITVIGVTGNALVIYVIAMSPRMRSSVTTLLLLNLAIADLLFLFITVPFTAYKFYSSEWSFGNLACQLVQYSLYVSVYVTIYTLVAISVLRFGSFAI